VAIKESTSILELDKLKTCFEITQWVCKLCWPIIWPSWSVFFRSFKMDFTLI